MAEAWKELFSTAQFMPHGHCYLWQPAILWLQVLSNGLIGCSYVAISSTLAYVVYRLKDDMPFRAMYLAFGAFIVLCGLTHFIDVYVIWQPVYWFDGAVRVLTGIVSAVTAVLLPRLIPDARALARGAHAARERGVELETAVQDWQLLYQKTRDLEQLKSQFFANVSHELRTPLTLILGPVEKLLALQGTPEDQRRDLDVVLRNARTLHKHVDDLLDAAKLEAGRMKPDHAEVDAALLVRVAASNFDALALQRDIAYVTLSPESIPAQLDPDQIQQVVHNLLSNAFKFTPEHGCIRCSVELEPHSAPSPQSSAAQRVVIRVADSGPGIAAEHREVVFERFRQLDGDATRRIGGTGLGLAIARDLVGLHGGSIHVAQAPEGGALFTVDLPRSAPPGSRVWPSGDVQRSAPARAALPVALARGHSARPDPAPADGATAEGGAAETSSRPARPLVLVVEDNADMSAFVAAALSAEWRTECARDGEQGLEKALALRPDLIVSDVMMPRMSGDLLLRALRTRPELAAVPVVLLTARADESLRIRMLREGAQDYVTKPFAAEELRARVANLLEMKRTQDVLRDARSAAETARSELESFSYSVAHDLRAPLRGIDGFSRAVLEDCAGQLDTRAVDHLNRVRAGVRRMGQLIEALLNLARLVHGELRVERVDLSGLARDAVAALQGAEPEREVQLVIADGLETQGDARLLELLLENLLGNAWKFTSKQDAARIEFGRSGAPDAPYYVRDDGAGFDMAYASRLFGAFRRLHDASEFEGTGIGLATAQRIIRRHGGTIWGEGEVGKGAVFYFTLPQRPPPGH